MIEQLGDIPLKQIGVLDTGSGELQMNNEGGKERRTPFRLAHDQVQPHPDVGKVGRIGQRLPVFIDTHDARMLEAEADHPPEEGLHHAAVAAIENLSSQHLDTLERSVREFPDIGLQQLESGQQKLLDLLEALLPDQLHQTAIDLPQGFLMNEIQPVRIHNLEQEQQFPVLTEVNKR
ncbi:MAG: hypothetical protein ACD_75C00557G0003 [uncultured bacterium]|nr:MAG: hypothetical protein ACD_75C00557G0003 [uncultured bacterium]